MPSNIYLRFLIQCGIISKQIIDEKSLIKKYQREISVLKLELDQLKRGMLVGVNHEELLTLKQKVFTFLASSDIHFMLSLLHRLSVIV